MQPLCALALPPAPAKLPEEMPEIPQSLGASGAIEQRWLLPAPINAAMLNRSGSHWAITTADGLLYWLDAQTLEILPPQMVHQGTSLVLRAGCDALSVLSAGDDGRLVQAFPSAETKPKELFKQAGKWLEQMDAHPSGLIAVSAGKNVYLLSAAGAPLAPPLPHAFTPEGLAINPKGKRVAVGHFGGISLWWVKAKEHTAQKLEWPGVHCSLIWHPDGEHIIAAQHEAQLHGWRLIDMAEMRMQGYMAKVESMCWSKRAKYLATSGAEMPICWPFFGGGPWNKAPLQPGSPRESVVVQLACHPADDLLAAAHADGLLQLCSLESLPGFMVCPPSGSNNVALSWSLDGRLLLAADAAGNLNLLTAQSVKNGQPLI